jgi:CBS domain containing-hemolysin-like protein
MTDKDPISWIKNLLSNKKDDGDDHLREALAEYIEELSNDKQTEESPSPHERLIMSNILELRNMVASDVMIPRTDIVAADISMAPEEFLNLLSEKQYSRVPVYRESLDDVLGTIHIKDVLSAITKNEPFSLQNLIREALVVSPALPVSDLLLLMKQSKKHLAFVIDEYGGIDGMVTIGDIVESIVGEIQDEYVSDAEPTIELQSDGTFIADARIDLYEFEQVLGISLSDDEREDVNTLAGLIYNLIGRVPSRGEIITEGTLNLNFEILDVDPRRVHRVKIHRINA